MVVSVVYNLGNGEVQCSDNTVILFGIHRNGPCYK